MPEDLTEILANGSIGMFWPYDDGAPLELRREPLRGHVQAKEGWAHLEALHDPPDEGLSGIVTGTLPAPPDAIAGSLPKASVLLLEVTTGGVTRQFGGFRASVERYRARTIIDKVPLDLLASSKLTSLQAQFLGISNWAGVTAASESFDTDQRGRSKVWQVRLESREELKVRLSGGGSLHIEAYWRAGGPTDQRIVTTPTAVTVKYPEPHPVWDLLQPVARIQDLLSFLYGGFLPAHAGSAGLHLRRADDHPTPTPGLWNGLLKVPNASAPEIPKNEWPLMGLPSLGGIRGLARWVKTSINHPRAVGPFLNPYRLGPLSSELSVMDVAAGVEYWVNAHTRSEAWAKVDKKAGRVTHQQRLAAHLGKSFKAWVGNPDAWAEALRGANNDLKHNPAASLDHRLLSDLAVSGRIALAAAVLNKVAGNKQPGAAIFGHHRFDGLGQRLRDRLG